VKIHPRLFAARELVFSERAISSFDFDRMGRVPKFHKAQAIKKIAMRHVQKHLILSDIPALSSIFSQCMTPTWADMQSARIAHLRDCAVCHNVRDGAAYGTRRTLQREQQQVLATVCSGRGNMAFLSHAVVTDKGISFIANHGSIS